jgi:MFS transporter, FHS family, L-fucose permease
VAQMGTAGGTSSANNISAPFALVAAVVGLFFIWGGLTSLNDILIPKLKGLFQLSYAEAMLTQFAFFMAYFIVSLPAGHLIARVGYLKGIVIGLGVMALGCLMFVPAAGSGVYATFLAALFVLAGGITILQVAANPLIANLGSAATSHSRLTFAQAFNSLGTTIFPPIGGALILGSTAPGNETSAVSQAYVGIAIILAAVAAFFWLRRKQLPTSAEAATQMGGSFGLLRLPRLGGGVASIFLYVGAEVAILGRGYGWSLHWCGGPPHVLAGESLGKRGLRRGSAGLDLQRLHRQLRGLVTARGRFDERHHVPDDLQPRG